MLFMNISDFNKDQKPNFAGFEVIGAGLPRTGTNSLRTALNFLLDGAVYHMFQVAFGEKVDANFWEKALKRPMTKREWRDFLVGRGFRAGVDYPISMFYKELMVAFPDAKVILTVRDPETWYESVKNSIYKTYGAHTYFPMNLFAWIMGIYKSLTISNRLSMEPARGAKKGLFEVIGEGKEASVEFYNNWIEEVKRNVPEDRLLIFNVKEGWKPLCDFLNVPIPDQPFPKTNDTAQMNQNIFRGKLEAIFWFIGLPLLFGIVLYYFHGGEIGRQNFPRIF